MANRRNIPVVRTHRTVKSRGKYDFARGIRRLRRNEDQERGIERWWERHSRQMEDFEEEEEETE